MVFKQRKRLDRLTNTWTEAAAEVMINEYLKEAENWGGDGLFLLEAANGGTETSGGLSEAGGLPFAVYPEADGSCGESG